ncbi:GNAT family N-acetyltransferase [Devosia sp. CAU 1758]
MPITIRPITLADAEIFHDVLDSVARERRFLRLTSAPPLERSRSFISSNLTNGNPQFVALDDGILVGWCDICRSEETGSEHCGSLGMGLLASHRGLGIGTNLLAATLNAARTGFHRVELDVYASNTSAITLYEKVGFAHEGRRRNALLRDGLYEDIVMMGMLLNPVPPRPALS